MFCRWFSNGGIIGRLISSQEKRENLLLLASQSEAYHSPLM